MIIVTFFVHDFIVYHDHIIVNKILIYDVPLKLNKSKLLQDDVALLGSIKYL
jgi:hypothetical protein